MKAIINRYKNKIIAVVIVFLISFSTIYFVKFSLLEKDFEREKYSLELCESSNKEMYKTIEKLKKDILNKEKIVKDNVLQIKELSDKKCETIEEIYNLPKKDNYNEKVTCDIDDDIPSSLNSLFESKGY